MSTNENVVELLVVLETPDGTWQGKGRWPEPSSTECWAALCSHVLWSLAAGVLVHSPELAYVNLSVFATGLVFQQQDPAHPVEPASLAKLHQHADGLSWAFAPKDVKKGD